MSYTAESNTRRSNAHRRGREHHNEIIALFKEGITRKELQEMFNISDATVSRHLQEEGIRWRGTRSKEMKCANCRKKMKRSISYLGREERRHQKQYCSFRCRVEAQIKYKKLKRICEFCEKEFEESENRVAEGRGRFCSKDCMTRSAHRYEKCHNCEEVHLRTANKNGRDESKLHIFCSNACHLEFIRRGGYKEVLRERTRRMLKEGRMPCTNTSIHRAVKGWLEELGVEFEEEEPFGEFVVDFYIPGENIIIEADGDYWHCNPAVYPDGPINEMQAGKIKKDRCKDFCLPRDFGCKIIHFWESDINNRPEECKKRLIVALGNEAMYLHT